jgi:multiple antibiotic resistance protein
MHCLRQENMHEKFIQDAIILWATVDPISTAALFVVIGRGLSVSQRRRVALRATLTAAGVLLGFIVIGQVVLTAMGISLEALQIAGGAMLFLFGIQMIFGSPAKFSTDAAERGHSLAVFPLAIPSIASPGAILASVLRTDNHLHSVGTQIQTTLILLAILAITYLMMVWSTKVHALIGDNGSAIAGKVMGLFLGALAAEMMIEGIRLAFDV